VVHYIIIYKNGQLKTAKRILTSFGYQFLLL
jgi:hypothetical protein